MTEFNFGNPTPEELEHSQRVAWACYSQTIRHLGVAGVLGKPALELIREDLRHGDWRADCVPESHRSQHTELLHDVTAGLVAFNPSLAAYYEGCGDMLPSAPVDASAIIDGLSG